MKLIIGQNYQVVATPNEQYKCKDITITGLEEQPKTTVDPETGIGTCNFTMAAGVTAIDASFENVEPTGEDVTIGNGEEDPEGTAPSTDKHGTVTVNTAE